MANRYPPSYRGPVPPAPPKTDGRPDVPTLMTPKSVVSLAIWIMMFGLGVGVAGLLLFIIYQGQLNSTEARILKSQEDSQKKFDQRLQQLEQRQSAPQPAASLNVSSASTKVRDDLIRNIAPAIVGIQGVDAAGKPISGTGFIVNSTQGDSWVITNYSLVAGSKPDAGGTVTVRLGSSEIIGQVYEVDPGADLALVTVNVPAPRSLRFTRGELKTGDTVWVFGSTRGNPYATALEAKLVAYSPAQVQVDVDPGPQFNGGPVIDSTGRVVAVLSSRAPKPAGKAPASPTPAASPGAVSRSATPVIFACNVVIRCPGAKASPNPSASPKPSPKAAPSPQVGQPTAPVVEPSPGG